MNTKVNSCVGELSTPLVSCSFNTLLATSARKPNRSRTRRNFSHKAGMRSLVKLPTGKKQRQKCSEERPARTSRFTRALNPLLKLRRGCYKVVTTTAAESGYTHP